MATESKPNRTEVRARLFRALGDVSRCQIVDLLRESGELRVGDLASAFEMSLNGVSKHIKVLEHAGIVARRHEGVSHYLSIHEDAFTPLTEWLHGDQSWERRLNSLEHIVTSGEAKKTAPSSKKQARQSKQRQSKQRQSKQEGKKND